MSRKESDMTTHTQTHTHTYTKIYFFLCIIISPITETTEHLCYFKYHTCISVFVLSIALVLEAYEDYPNSILNNILFCFFPKIMQVAAEVPLKISGGSLTTVTKSNVLELVPSSL